MWKYKWNWEDMLSMDGWVWRCQVWNCSNLRERPLNCPFVFFILSLEDRASHSKFDDFLKLRKVREQNHTKSGASRPPELEVKRFQGCFAVVQDGFKGLRRYGRRPGRRVTQKQRCDKDQWTCFWQLVPGAVAGSAFIATPGLSDGREWWSSPQKPRHWALHGGSQTKTGALRASRAAPQVWQRIRKIQKDGHMKKERRIWTMNKRTNAVCWAEFPSIS